MWFNCVTKTDFAWLGHNFVDRLGYLISSATASVDRKSSGFVKATLYSILLDTKCSGFVRATLINVTFDSTFPARSMPAHQGGIQSICFRDDMCRVTFDAASSAECALQEYHLNYDRPYRSG